VNDGNEKTCPTIFHVTHWKAGSQWIFKILRECTPDLIIPAQVAELQFLHDKVQSGKVYPTVYVTKEQFDSVELPEDWRRFIVFRDLRDTLISGYFSMKISHPIISPRIAYQREILQDLNQEDGLIFLLDVFLNDSANIQRSWLDAGEPFLRYEDLIANDVEILTPILLDQCRLPVSREKLEEVIIANRFDRWTGGRERGQEDITSHARKGIAGDWKNYFTPRVERIFNAKYGDLIVRTGYEVSEDYGLVTPGFSPEAEVSIETKPIIQYESLLERSVVQLNVRNDEVALKLLDEAVEMNPNNSAILYGKALALTRLGEIDQAALCLDRVITDFPSHRRARYLQWKISHLPVQSQSVSTEEEESQIPNSPITGSTNIRFESEIDSRSIIEKYQKFYRIDVSPYIGNIPSIKIYECLDTGYRFYFPFDLMGDGRFYEQLQKFSWYYMDWKWEYQIAEAMVSPNSSLLEIGCGQGAFLEYIRKKGVAVTGMEMNEAAINSLKSKGIDAIMEPIQSYAQNHKEAFDFVCFFQVLEHIAAVKEFLVSTIDTIKPGGKLIISVPNNNAFMFMHDEDQLLNRPPHHMGLWTHQSLINLCRFFPLRLDGIEFEPVQPYHEDIHMDIVKYYLSKKNIDYGLLSPEYLNQCFSEIVKLFTDNIPGHTLLAHYTKIENGMGWLKSDDQGKVIQETGHQ
jgi:SAM-dependent methyltransferase